VNEELCGAELPTGVKPLHLSNKAFVGFDSRRYSKMSSLKKMASLTILSGTVLSTFNYFTSRFVRIDLSA